MSFGPRRGGSSYQSNYASRNNRNSYSSANDSYDEVNGFSRKKRKASTGTAFDPLFKEPAKPPQSPKQRASSSPNQQNLSYQRGGSRPNPFYNRARQEKLEFVDREHKGPQWDWQSFFHRSKNWQDKHKVAYYRSRCMALEFENKMLFDQITQLIDENTVFAMERGEVPTMRLPHIPEFDGQQLNAPRPNEVAQTTNTQPPQKKQGKIEQQQHKEAKYDSDSNNESLEVSEEMMNFIEKSMLHKLSLKLKKTEQKEKDKGSGNVDADEAVKQEEKNEKVKKMGPREPPGLKRKEELDKLYGSNSAIIHGLETAIQLRFNRICDLHKPEFWMTLPLNTE